MSRLTWKDILNAHTDKRNEMRAPALVGVIVALHLSVIGAFVFIQGCGTQHPRKPVEVSQPTPPVMPPKQAKAVKPVSRPEFRPPVASTPEPVNFDPSKANSYVVQKGDSLSKIANRNGVSSKDLAAVNKITDPNKIRIGQKLILPPNASGAPQNAVAPKAPQVSSSSSMVVGGTYIIQKGDSLSRIASRHGVTSKELAAANGISNPNKIRIGQKLKVPGNGSSASSAPAPSKPRAPSSVSTPAVAPAPVAVAPAIPSPAPAPAPAALAPEADGFSLGDYEYTLRDGESIEQVAKDNGTTVEAILKMNSLATPADIGPGSTVKIPLPGE